jgi:glycosyltransferase involved in cell wall biosynthesis
MGEAKTVLLHGKIETFCSFSLINLRLAAGLRALGYRVGVMPGDQLAADEPAIDQPDIYIAHDYPYDQVDAPGAFNVFILAYEYFRLVREDRALVKRLNACFDLLVVPSRFTRRACEESGIAIPIAVCPWGADHAEFAPHVRPAALPSRKRFTFVYVGGAFERKGTDILVRAFREEFTGADDVALVIKAFSYEWLRPWTERVLADGARPGGPELTYVHEVARSVAGYYTAADVGVFPFRGEGFGLPILECLAAGTPVIVTAGGAADDFCTEANAHFVRATRKTTNGRPHLEPDCRHLRRLMRAAFEAGPPGPERRLQVSASVARFTWERTVALLARAFEEGLAAKRDRQDRLARPPRRARVGWAHWTRGSAGWGKVAWHVDRRLRAYGRGYRALDRAHGPWPGALEVLVGQSGYALEHFAEARRLNPGVRLVLLRGDLPFDDAAEITDREMAACGVRPRAQLLLRPMRRWRDRRERELADVVVVWSQVARRAFADRGCPEERLVTIPLGMGARRRRARRDPDPFRFLFVAREPFRKGARLLLQAWDELKLQRAELVCVAGPEVVESPALLRLLVRNPSIRLLGLLPHGRLLQLYEAADCQVAPSLGDGFSMSVAEGMGCGTPAIVSVRSGIAEVLSHLGDAYLVESGSVAALKRGLAFMREDRGRLAAMGEAALETARRHPWDGFEAAVGALVDVRGARVGSYR